MHRMDYIFKTWPTMADMAREIGADPIAVRHWKRRKSIPGAYDARIVAAAAKRGAVITYEELAKMRDPDAVRAS